MKRFIDCYIPTETCNLRCHYCYIAQKRKFNNRLVSFSHSKEEIRAALSKQRLGGICLFNFCAGGETLLSDEILPIVKEILAEGHYAMIVTNGTIRPRFEEISLWEEELKERLFIKFSFHYLEMLRLHYIDKFFDNVSLMKSVGVSFTVEITTSDELIPYIGDIKTLCLEKMGTLPHITIARDDRTSGIDHLSKYNFEDYKKIWNQFDSDLFQFKSQIFYKKQKGFCYAGDWSIYLNLESGDYKQCYCGEYLGNIFNKEHSLIFKPIGYNCSLPHCYNGHAFLAMGDIPELNTPTYAELRNRRCRDGSDWLTHRMKRFMSSKLKENNKELSCIKKFIVKHNATSFRGILATFSFYQKLHDIKYRNR